MQTILVPAHFLEELRKVLRDEPVELAAYDQQGRELDANAKATALFRWWLTTEQGDRLLTRHPLRWIHTGSAGVEHILTPAFLDASIRLTNSSGVHAPSIAEWVVGGMLFLQKDIRSMLRLQAERKFEKVERSELSGATAVFLGAGHIAGEIAKRLRPFGMRHVAIRRTPLPHPLFDESFAIDALESLAGAADFLIIAAPLSDATRHLIDGRILSSMKRSSILVNVARGEIVDESALIDALREKRIAGAMLDVFEQEPLPSEHPLWALENVLLLPHTTWRSPEVRGRQLALFVENVRRYVRGEPLVNEVDVER
jgi:phosphoglycerate dehydrogenase-like enzyme